MATLDSPDTPKTDKVSPDKATTKRNKMLHSAISACRNYRRKLVMDWQTNVDYRRGKPFATQSDENRVVVNVDWSFTKEKQSSLFSQVPAVRVNHPPQTAAPEMAPWLHSYEQRINDTLIQAGIETAMDEVLPDCINAAGVGIVVVCHEALTEDVTVPAIDLATLPPAIQQQILLTGLLPNGNPLPMETVPRVIDKRYLVNRISPSNFLWPLSFTGSDFDNSPWIGRSGHVTWVEAQRRWKLDPNKKRQYLGIDTNPQDVISYDIERKLETESDELVSFEEVFYKKHLYDEDTKLYNAIQHVVFVHGQDEPVIDEPWKGQEIDNNGNLLGATKYPIRVLTLSYITDEAIPPSDSAVGRPQVNEIIKARTQMILQREHSLPVRTIDVNRVDPTVVYNLMRGKWQAMIPVQGNGQNVITEVARSNFPQENFSFDIIANRDLSRIWNLYQDATGAQVETKGEAQEIASSAQTRIARERAKVGKFFCGIAEVLGGLICLYEDPNTLGQGFDPVVSKTLAYSILADSTVLLDSNQRLQRIQEFVNMYAKSGWVNLEPVLKEAATLTGLDPATVIRAPQPAPPAEPNISLRLTGTEDLRDPMTVGILIARGQAPTPEQIEQGKQLILQAGPPPMQQLPSPAGNTVSADGTVTPPALVETFVPPVPMPIGGNTGPIPQPPPVGVGEDNPNYSSMPKVNQRVLDREGGL